MWSEYSDRYNAADMLYLDVHVRLRFIHVYSR